MIDVVAILGSTLQLYTVNAMLFIKVNMKSIYFHNIHACIIVQCNLLLLLFAFVIFHHNAITCSASECRASFTSKNYVLNKDDWSMFYRKNTLKNTIFICLLQTYSAFSL